MYVDSLKQRIQDWHYDGDEEYRESIDCYTKTVMDFDFKIIYQIEAYSESYANYINNFNGWVAGARLRKSNDEEHFYPRFGSQIISPLNNFVVNGTAYNEVYKITTDDDSGFAPGTSADVFIVKNIGIVEWKILYDDGRPSESWSLLSSHIVF